MTSIALVTVLRAAGRAGVAVCLWGDPGIGKSALIAAAAEADGVPCETVIATNSKPFDAIINTANERGCDLIVMTSRYRKGLVSLIVGSEAGRVLHRASIPVLVFRAVMSADHPDKTPPGKIKSK